MKKGALTSFCLLIGLLLLLCTQVFAELGRIRYGNLRIFPSAKIQLIHDDNIFLSSGENETTEKEEYDVITRLLPAILLNYSLGPRGGISLGYRGDLAYYRDNEDNNWRTHQGSFNADYFAPGGLIVGINNVYTDAEDPFGSQEQFNLGIKTKRTTNDLRSRVGFAFSKRFRVFGYYNYYRQDYARWEDFTQDYKVNEIGTGFETRLFPKTWGFIRYHYGEQDYFNSEPALNVTSATDADNDWHRVNAGFTWDTGARLTGELNFGYQWRDYENKLDARGKEYDDKDLWIAATSVTYNATATTVLALIISRALRTTGAERNEYFEDTAVELRVQQVLLPKLTLSAGGFYSKNDYNQPEDRSREDDNYNADINFRYQIKDWLGTEIGYKYMKKDSNFKEYEFEDNQFMVSATLAY